MPRFRQLDVDWPIDEVMRPRNAYIMHTYCIYLGTSVEYHLVALPPFIGCVRSRYEREPQAPT